MVNCHKPTEDSNCQQVLWLFWNLSVWLVVCLLSIVGIFHFAVMIGFWFCFGLLNIFADDETITIGKWLNETVSRFEINSHHPPSFLPTVHSVLSQFGKDSQNTYKVGQVLDFHTLLLLLVYWKSDVRCLNNINVLIHLHYVCQIIIIFNHTKHQCDPTQQQNKLHK